MSLNYVRKEEHVHTERSGSGVDSGVSTVNAIYEPLYETSNDKYAWKCSAIKAAGSCQLLSRALQMQYFSLLCTKLVKIKKYQKGKCQFIVGTTKKGYH